MKQSIFLWSPSLIAPLVWFLSLQANFALAPLACAGRGKQLLYIVSAIALLIVVCGAGFSWTQWRTSSGPSPTPENRAQPRLAGLVGLALSGLFLLVILAQTIPNLIMAGCE